MSTEQFINLPLNPGISAIEPLKLALIRPNQEG